jgi:hypothetical protein
LLAVLLAGLYLATVTVEPVFARNAMDKWSPKPEIKDHKDKINKPDKDNKDDDGIKVKSHLVLKSPKLSTLTAQITSK